MTPDLLAEAVAAAVRAAVADGDLALAPADIPADVVIERPRNPEHGDYATNIAMRLAKRAGRPPREVAQAIAEHLVTDPGVASVDIAGPGFINITVETAAAGRVVADVVAAGAAYGTSDTLAGQRINLEYISANPTGPLHLGHTRWAAVGDAMARVLAAAGAEVGTEFYVNDRGVQMDRFGASLVAAAHGRPAPSDGYHGGYIIDLASAIVAEHPEALELSGDDAMEFFRDQGYALQLAQQQQVLRLFRTEFDVWYSERHLHDSGAVERGFAALDAAGHTYDSDGAKWLRTSEFGDDKDRVLVKSDGEMTYFASDSAYYVDKRARGFDVNIYLLGADHHGYVGRLKAIAACAGDDPDFNIEVLIGQLVKIYRSGEEVRLSKRAGDIVTLEDLVDEVGVDAARYSLIRYPADSPLTLDLDLLVKRTNDNPVFYVQYAHARISSVLRHAADLGIDWQSAPFDASLLGEERERDLIGVIADLPRVVGSAAELREPHRVARYLEELANAYHKFYDSCRVLPRGDEKLTEVGIARLWLCAAARQTLSNGLTMLGVSAPERM
ncbi:MAG: arginine--tRNA ligase [Actinobacteria bacterium]|nr:MAG: arginine--tRNA ligase [Actinomycetota bacterium]